MDDWLNPKVRLSAAPHSELPRLVLFRKVPFPEDVTGVLTRVSLQDGPTHLLIIPNATVAETRGVAGLVALAILDAHAALMRPTFMPLRAPFALLKADGSVRISLTRQLQGWAIEEHQRLAAILLGEHHPWLTELCESIRGEGSIRCVPPENFPLTGNPDDFTVITPPTIEVDMSAAIRTYKGLERYQVVQLDYERDRYMRHLSPEQLATRCKDIFLNIHQVNREGQISFEGERPKLHNLMDLFGEVLHESVLRKMDFNELTSETTKSFPFPRKSDLPKRIAKCVAEANLPSNNVIVKYGRREHLLEAFKFGRLRIMPASRYLDPSLNPAQQDDELSVNFNVDTTVFKVLGPGARNVADMLEVIGKVTSNFYVFCMSRTLRARLFLDFDADACLIIREPEQFRERLRGSLAALLPDFRFAARLVEYYDPLSVSPAEIRPPCWKHFRHAYQEEVRFVAIPSKRATTLEPLFVSLGSLEGIADYREVPSCLG